MTAVSLYLCEAARMQRNRSGESGWVSEQRQECRRLQLLWSSRHAPSANRVPVRALDDSCGCVAVWSLWSSSVPAGMAGRFEKCWLSGPAQQHRDAVVDPSACGSPADGPTQWTSANRRGGGKGEARRRGEATERRAERADQRDEKRRAEQRQRQSAERAGLVEGRQPWMDGDGRRME